MSHLPLISFSHQEENHNQLTTSSCHFHSLPSEYNMYLVTRLFPSLQVTYFFSPCTNSTLAPRYPSDRRTAVEYRGHVETSIKGSWLSKVPLCVVRNDISVALLSVLPAESKSCFLCTLSHSYFSLSFLLRGGGHHRRVATGRFSTKRHPLSSFESL